MVTISYKILFINQKIMVCVKLPEFAIYHIKVLIREVPRAENRTKKVISIQTKMTTEWLSRTSQLYNN